MATVKLSISLSDEDVEFIDAWAEQAGLSSRSAVVQQALARLRASDMLGDYADAWDEWQAEGDDESWDAASGDGASARSASAQQSAGEHTNASAPAKAPKAGG